MRLIHLCFLIGVLLLGFLIQPALGFDHSHSTFDKVLKEAVLVIGPKSQVRYGLIQKKPGLLDQYLGEVQSVTQSQYQQWSEHQKIAFLINAYNALTIKLILSKYPDLKSIKDLGGFFSGPWKIKFFTLFGEKQHLDYIEHEMLRKQFKEPRIHFALVCASIGCPALRDEVYIANRLNDQLNKAAKLFIRDTDRNRYNSKSDSLEISSIFKWFKGDFIKTHGSVEKFISRWITNDKELQNRIQNKEIDIDYLSYDWNINAAD